MNLIVLGLVVIILTVIITTLKKLIQTPLLLVIILFSIVLYANYRKGDINDKLIKDTLMTNLEKRALKDQNLTPPLSDSIKYGISYLQHVKSTAYVETVANNVVVPGMAFDGIDVPTPMEHYRNTVTNTKPYELRVDQTDFWPIKLKFTHKGQPFTVNPHIIDIEVGNISTINGSKVTIKPILTDSCSTGIATGVLFKTLPNKVTVRSMPRLLKFTTGDEEYMEEVGMCHGEHMPNCIPMPFAIMICYEFGLAEFGITILKVDDWDGNGTLITNQAINDNQLGIIIDKKTCTDYAESVRVAAALLYLSIVHSEALLAIDNNSKSVFATIHQSRINGKYTRKGDELVHSKSLLEIETIKYDTINQIANYGDPISIARLKSEGIITKNYTDMMRWITNNYSESYMLGKTTGRYLDSIYYTMYGLTSALYKGTKPLNNIAQRNTTFVTSHLNKRFRSIGKNVVYGLSGSKKNLTTTPLKGAGDNKYMLSTGIIDHQNRGDGVFAATRANSQFNSPVVKSDDSDLGDIHWATKSFNSPTSKLNLCIELDENYKVVVSDPNFNKLLNSILI